MNQTQSSSTSIPQNRLSLVPTTEQETFQPPYTVYWNGKPLNVSYSNEMFDEHHINGIDISNELLSILRDEIEEATGTPLNEVEIQFLKSKLQCE
jgi:hypothetical protein